MSIPQIYRKFSLFWNTVVLGLIFWIPSIVWWDSALEPMKQGTYYGSVVIMFIVFLTWLPSAIRIFLTNSKAGDDLLLLAVFLVAFVFLQSTVLRALNLYYDRPNWLFFTPAGAFISYQIMILGVLISFTVFKSSGVYLENFKRRATFALVLSGFVFGVLIGLSL